MAILDKDYVRGDELREALGGIYYSTLTRWVRSKFLPEPLRMTDRILLYNTEEVRAFLDIAPSQRKLILDQEYVRPDELREALGGISTNTLTRWVDADILPAPKQIGPRALRFDTREVKASLAQMSRGVGIQIENDS